MSKKVIRKTNSPSIRLFDCAIGNKQSKCIIEFFGMDENKNTYCVFVENFKPYFYVEIPESWSKSDLAKFINHLNKEISEDESSDEEPADLNNPQIIDSDIIQNDCKIEKKHKLYGFNDNKKFKFAKIVFKNTKAFNEVKNLWFTKEKDFKKRKLIKEGYIYKADKYTDAVSLILYEAKLPPLLRYFHIKNISPSGWVKLTNANKVPNSAKQTTCKYEYTIDYKNVQPQPEKETAIPLKVCSFDIEASSSHGDFPLSKKTYKKLAADLITYYNKHKKEIQKMEKREKEKLMRDIILTAFNYKNVENINIVYPKKKISKTDLLKNIEIIFNNPIEKTLTRKFTKRKTPLPVNLDEEEEADETDNPQETETTVENENIIEVDEEYYEKQYEDNKWRYKIPRQFEKQNLYHIIFSKIDSTEKISILENAFALRTCDRCNNIVPIRNTCRKKTCIDARFIKKNDLLPKLEGDKCTFVGSTFLRMGEKEPYLNHIAVLNTCSDMENVENAKIECYEKERELLIGWSRLIKRENPDVIIGYNIFGFDWKFLVERCEEQRPNCKKEFLINLSRRKITPHNEWRLRGMYVKSSIKIASGTHDLEYVKMPGRIQLDLYNYFRREVNLNSYKLDFVASHFIGDYIFDYQYDEETKETTIKSKNLMGLKNGHYICFELLAHSSDMYKNGKKFIVQNLTKGEFTVKGKLEIPPKTKVRWCLAKDDVSPQDIFRLTNEGPSERAIVAKYCIQDCNLVHNLMIKNDIYTGMSEMAKISSVPIDFIIMRGQGIKLLSFISKKCSVKNTLLPMLEKVETNDGYQGAFCLKPKRGFYVDEPVAVVDYSSLYPSSMISENISHDSKVWTKEYNLKGELIKITGERDEEGNFIYDNLKEYQYVDIEYDTYVYVRKTPKAAAVKQICGKKICRFAQFPDGKKAIMPSVLVELLASRKATRKFIKYKTIETTDGDSYSGLVNKGDETTVVTTKDNEKIKINNDDISKIYDTYDDFMKNVFDKRQLAFKVTANSLYGQCGAKTSSFYEKDIAASTTATGRKLLIYGKNLIENCYKNREVDTKYGKMVTHADTVYGDSVTHDTPLLLRNKETGNIEFMEISKLAAADEWRSYDGFKAGESNRKEKQQKSVDKYEIYTSNGWSNINRVIRHKTTKKIYRVTTHTGTVDVTEDHSLLDENNNIIKPKDTKIGMHLLHNYPKFKKKEIKLSDFLDYIENIQYKTREEKRAFIYGFFFGDGSCGKYDCPSGIKYSWALNNQNMKLLSKLRVFCIDEFGFNFKINNTYKSSGVYKLVPNGGQTKKNKELVIMFRKVCYNENKYKIVPIEFLNADETIKFAYLSGYYAADGAKCSNSKTKNIHLSNKGKIGSSMLYYMFSSIGLNVSVNTRKDKLNITSLSITSEKLRKHTNVLKKVDELYTIENDEFVYDIETVTGNFNTGYPLIVKNTDSCFLTFGLTRPNGEKVVGQEALEVTITLGIEAGELASKFLKAPHDLEYEKTFSPFLLLSKKRYVGMLYEINPHKCKRKSMGIVLKRRDNAPIVKDIYGGIIDILMKDHDVNKAVKFTKTFLKDIVDEKHSIKKLIISKSLRGYYKNPDSIAHKVLADRIAKRDPGNKPSTGSRIPYVYIQTKGKVKLQGDKVEHPDYIKKHNLKPDFTFYITNQIMKPVQQVFALVLEDINEFKCKVKSFKKKCDRLKELNTEAKWIEKEEKLRNTEVEKLIFSEALIITKNQKNKQKSITSFFG